MNLTSKTCFFTGHRLIEKSKISQIESWLKEEILDKINHKVKVFIAGGAIGFDTIAAEQVLFMKEDYPDIKLCLYLPCINQDEDWGNEDRERFDKIKKNADEIYYISKGKYKQGCMKKRNKAMVEASDCGIAYLKNHHSGASQTVNMAIEKGIDVVNIADKLK